MELKMFYDMNLPNALKGAQGYAKERRGCVLSMPQLIQTRINSGSDDELWHNWYTALSEEIVCKTPHGNDVVIVLHGGGMLTPERIQRAYNGGYGKGLTSNDAVRIINDEVKDLLEGKLFDGNGLPMFSSEEFSKTNISDSDRNYGVIMDFDTIRKTESGNQDISKLSNNPLFIARVGGIEQATEYLDKAKKVYKTEKMGNWHYFEHIDPAEAQGRLLVLGNNDSFGVCGTNPDDLLDRLGHFVAKINPLDLQFDRFDLRKGLRTINKSKA